MNCRLCNEKIPRMRALFKKSEFCCDEHAERYKEQTLDRLLAEQARNADGTAPLPIPPADDGSLASLESRTPMLEGETVLGGPRRLPPPRPLPVPAERPTGFGGLLDRLPEKKSTAQTPGNIGGWDQAGGEDPLEALMRLERAAPAPPAGLGVGAPASSAASNSPSEAASSSEDDAISALRRLAEEARRGARAKPLGLTGPEAGGEDPFARLASGNWSAPKPPPAEDAWAPADPPSITPSQPPVEQASAEFQFDGFENGDLRPEHEAGDGLSMFDRLVRNFDSEPSNAPKPGIEESVPPPLLGTSADAWDQLSSETSSPDEDAPFVGSVFDRLMADAPKTMPSKSAGSLGFERGRVASPASDADPWGEHPEQAPIAEKADPIAAIEGNEDRAEPAAEEAAKSETIDETAQPATAHAPPKPAPAAPAKSRKSAPIEPKMEMSNLFPAGWPNEQDLSPDEEDLERIFALRRASESALSAPASSSVIEPSGLNLPLCQGLAAISSGASEKLKTIPWHGQIRSDTTAEPIGAASEHFRQAPSSAEASGPMPSAPSLRMPGAVGTNGHSHRRFRNVGAAGRVVEIVPADPPAAPLANISLPALECLPANGRSAAVPPLASRAAALGRGAEGYTPRLDLTDVLPFSGVAEEHPVAGNGTAALTPTGPIRMPGSEHSDTSLRSNRAAVPGAVAGLASAEPAGCSFEFADLDQMRRLVAEQTTTVVGPNGHSGSRWDPAIQAEPFNPALNLENGNRP